MFITFIHVPHAVVISSVEKGERHHLPPPFSSNSTETAAVSGSNRVSTTQTAMVCPSVPLKAAMFNENVGAAG